MVLFDTVLITGARLGLFVGCRVIALPLLYGQAKYAALEASSTSASSGAEDESHALSDLPRRSSSSLPRPVTAGGAKSRLGSNGTWKSLRAGASTVQNPAARKELLAGVVQPSSVVAILFSAALEEVTVLFVLVLLEAAGYDHATLKANWNISLSLTILFAVVLIRECERGTPLRDVNVVPRSHFSSQHSASVFF